jgi:hypothetical protein
MDPNANRRQALMSLSLGAAGLAGLGANSASAKASAPNLIPPGASALSALSARLATAPRRRDFKTLPMFVTADEQWDKAAFDAVLAYRGGPKQVWHNRELNGGWLYLMDNAISAQVFSFKHLDFLAVSATHGTAGLALFDETAWDKYQFGKLTKSRAVANTWIADKGDGDAPQVRPQPGQALPRTVGRRPDQPRPAWRHRHARHRRLHPGTPDGWLQLY